MGGGGVTTKLDDRQKAYEANFTVYVLFVCIVAAGAGLLFGFDNGIIGGVTGTADFQQKFLPDVYYRNFVNTAGSTPYCKFDSQILQLYVSVLYLAAGIAAPVAGLTAERAGRKICLLVSGIAFGAGLVLLAAAQDVAMVVIGRVLMGVGVAFANSSATLFITEMAPPKLRGGLGVLFQLVQTVGILVAYVYNYAFHSITWGWRLSVALGGVFAAMVSIGAIFLPDTPPSLLSRGHPEKARRVLERVRGTSNVDLEFQELVDIVAASKAVPNTFRSLLLDPRYRPQLFTVILMPIAQQWTGINSVIFYTPQIFAFEGTTKGLEDTVVLGAVNVAATLIASFTVDRFGRKLLFLTGTIGMVAADIVIGATLGVMYGRYPSGDLPKPAAQGLLAVFLVFVASYAWSYGPLPWLIPTEVQPLETRAAAASINVTLNMLMTFVVAQSFQTQLCSMHYGVFLFFAGLTLLWYVLILLFIPETKGKSMDQIAVGFARHWFWGKQAAVRQYGEDRGAFDDSVPEGGMTKTARDRLTPQLRESMGRVSSTANNPSTKGGLSGTSSRKIAPGDENNGFSNAAAAPGAAPKV